MGADEIIPKVWLGSLLGLESARKASITAIVQVSETELPASVCAAYQKAGIEPVHFQIEHANLLPIFERFYTFMNRRLQAKRKTLVLEKGGGTACLVAYLMRIRDIGSAEALRLMQSKRRSIAILEGYTQQLKVWHDCEFEVYERVNGRKAPKRPYVEWIEREVGKRAQSQLDQYCAHT